MQASGRRTAVFATFAAAALSISACARLPKTYVVLLPNPDGSVGAVEMTGKEGSRVVREPRRGTGFDPERRPVDLSDEEIRDTFGSAMAAEPAAPVIFILYFKSGTTDLTDPSRRRLPEILATVRGRAAPDVDVVGHTDRYGPSRYNERLARARARKIRNEIVAIGVDRALVETTSHGENNPLIPTPDRVREPRNRRVEVTIR